MKRLHRSLKIGLYLFLVFLITSEAMAQRYRGRRSGSKSTTFKVGYYNPKNAKSGILFGLNLGGSVDETVDIGFGVDLFHKSYQQESVIAESVSAGGVIEEQKQLNLDFSTTAIPLMGTINVKLGANMPFAYFIAGGLGYALLWNKENNYADDISEKRFYHGFTWQVGGGAMYQLGSRSYLIGEVLYNDSHLKRDKGKTENGLPVWTEVDMSGFSFRLGVRLGR